MSGLNASRYDELDRLQKAYEQGELSQKDANNLLAQAIEQELDKPDQEIDNAWINACADMIAYVNQEEIARVPDRGGETWKAIQMRIQEKQHSQKNYANGWMKHIVGVAACLVLILTSASYSWRWFQPSQSTDEQVYTISGQEVQINAESHAFADPGNTVRECHTANLHEFINFLGYTPPLPSWLPDGWTPKEYNAYSDAEGNNITVVYTKKNEDSILMFDSTYAHDVSTFSSDYYQDEQGQYVLLRDGLEVYITTNAGQMLATWHNESSVASVSGPISLSELEEFILSIQ